MYLFKKKRRRVTRCRNCSIDNWSFFCLSLILLSIVIIVAFLRAVLFASGLEGRGISPLCPGASTLKPWKMLRWKMKMEKIYPCLLPCTFSKSQSQLNSLPYRAAITLIDITVQCNICHSSLLSLWLWRQQSALLLWMSHSKGLFPWQLCTLSEFTAAVLTVLCCSCFMEEVTLPSHGQCSRWGLRPLQRIRTLWTHLYSQWKKINPALFQPPYIYIY